MRALGRHPWYVWVVWAAAASAVFVCPMLVAEPMIVYLADPELLLLAVLIGSEHARVTADVRLLQLRALGLRLRGIRVVAPARTSVPTHPTSTGHRPAVIVGVRRDLVRSGRHCDDRTGPGRPRVSRQRGGWTAGRRP